MIRTLIGLFVIVLAILWCPLWIQMVLFVVAVLVLRYGLLLLVPAVLADALYSPAHTMELSHFKTTLVVGGLIIVWYLVTTHTRIAEYV